MSTASNEATPTMFGVKRCLSSEIDRAETSHKVMVAEVREAFESTDNLISWLSHPFEKEIEHTKRYRCELLKTVASIATAAEAGMVHTDPSASLPAGSDVGPGAPVEDDSSVSPSSRVSMQAEAHEALA